ncbi:MAG: GspE/PulE family protein [Firmicutes bacterium]|nr:GspE/PulE family protein [Bacillota bacterium]
MNDPKLIQFGQTLIDAEIVTAEQWKAALERKKATDLPIQKILLDMGLVTEDESEQLLELYYGAPHVKLSEYILEREALELVTEDICRHSNAIPMSISANELMVAMSDPKDIVTIDTMRQLSGKDIKVVYSSPEEIAKALDMYYAGSDSVDSGLKKIARKSESSSKKKGGEELNILKELSEEAPVVQLVNDILVKAIQARASDIHFEPTKSELMVRFRIDGILRVFLSVPLALHPAVISRLKVMGAMDITEKRLPQDGRAEIRIRDRVIDLRMSTLPLIFGEKLVIRILDKRMAVLSLDRLGFCKDNLEKLKSLVGKAQGMILVSGPTGSGKTSTTYAIGNKLRSIEKNIISVEDPVEYQIDLVNQVQVQPRAGLDFATSLRAILRQDPDIILVGEIRDLETAQMAVHAALTGHVVLSTIHTNDSPTALTRLIDMGIPPFLIAAAVSGVISQRLIRLICPQCKEEYTPIPGEWESVFGMEFPVPPKVYRGIGCKNCNRTGYYGRTAVSEVMMVTEKIRTALITNPSSDNLVKSAKDEGLLTMRDDALIKVSDGTTTLEEILRMNV